MKDQEYYLPKYFKISRKIISRIQNGELLPGMRIPSENEIIAKYKVSNTTARKILHEIENAGWAVRIKGKGTFVRARNVERSVTRILGFNRNMIEAGYAPSTKVLDTELLRDGYSLSVNGRYYAIKTPVYKIHRLRFADDVPMMLELRYIATDLCPGIEKLKLTGSLYEVYENNYGLKLTEVNQTLSALIITDPRTKALFGIKEPIPAFLVSGVTFCGKEMILEMEESIYRGDQYRFSVRAT